MLLEACICCIRGGSGCLPAGAPQADQVPQVSVSMCALPVAGAPSGDWLPCGHTMGGPHLPCTSRHAGLAVVHAVPLGMLFTCGLLEQHLQAPRMVRRWALSYG